MRPAFKALIANYGPDAARRDDNAREPFYRLVGDGIWQVEDIGGGTRRPVSDNPHGGFSPQVIRLLHDEPWLIDWAANLLLTREFPPTYHDSIREAVGLNAPQPDHQGQQVRDQGTLAPWHLPGPGPDRRPRSPEFRHRVLAAYDHRCALCGYSIRLKGALVGLEAAHIYWHCLNGPDEVRNGLALCSTHHRALDFGCISLRDDLRVLVSDHIEGNPAHDLFLRFKGEPLAHLPADEALRPAPTFLAWHREQVYARQSREA